MLAADLLIVNSIHHLLFIDALQIQLTISLIFMMHNVHALDSLYCVAAIAQGKAPAAAPNCVWSEEALVAPEELTEVPLRFFRESECHLMTTSRQSNEAAVLRPERLPPDAHESRVFWLPRCEDAPQL